ncbi:hypothetical protein WJX73_002574 [Symbiochloris irregularis]|uniref:Class II aldolase/adducin N-terminal domain-containing protein n=1 Tax=Symbiochloris irregularis TaxID=706552 RepID=A0AAW1P0W3_9CHLO
MTRQKQTARKSTGFSRPSSSSGPDTPERDATAIKRLKRDLDSLPKGFRRSEESYIIAPDEWELRADLAAAYRLCHQMGLNEGVCNHLTALLPGSKDTFLLIPFGLLWSEGKGTPETTAFWIHSRFHMARPKEAAVVFHTHMPWTTSICCLEDPKLPMIHQNCLRFYEDIAYDHVYPGSVQDTTEGDRMASAMGDARVMLHVNHGVIICGPTLWQALDDLYYLERAAEIVVKARSQLLPVKNVDAETCAKFKAGYDKEADEYAWRHFSALKRTLDAGYLDRSAAVPAELLSDDSDPETSQDMDEIVQDGVYDQYKWGDNPY